MKIINQLDLEKIAGGNGAEKPSRRIPDCWLQPPQGWDLPNCWLPPVVEDMPIVDAPIIDWCGTKPKSK